MVPAGIARHRYTSQLVAMKILPLAFVLGSSTPNTRQAKVDKQRLGIDREIIRISCAFMMSYEGDKDLYLILVIISKAANYLSELFDFLVNRGKLPPVDTLACFEQVHSLNPPLIKIADWGMTAFSPRPPLDLRLAAAALTMPALRL